MVKTLFIILIFSDTLVKVQNQCQKGFKTCDIMSWIAWSECDSTCGGVRYRSKPICCVQIPYQQTFDECLLACKIPLSLYYKTNYEEQACKACNHGKIDIIVFGSC